jgi:glycerophosphoryl diester phosphodiesterase
MYSDQGFPLAVSHRGLRTNAPENTLAAFEAAIAAGAEGIELDVHASLDGVVFVHHDPVFQLDGETRAFAKNDSSLVSKARLDGDNPIPTLDQTLEGTGRRAALFVEIKARGIESYVARCLKRHSVIEETCAVHAFDHRIVKRMLELVPSIRTGILQVAYPIDSTLPMRAAGATDLWQHADFIDSRLVADVHSAGGRIIAWTPNAILQWDELSALGIDGICTDKVDEYVRWRSEAVEATQG